MIDDLRAIAIFAELVRQGSFRRTAKVLALSPSVVSYHVTQLEKRLGVALIYRSTRKISLSHEGETLYCHAEEMLAAAQQGLGKISALSRDPSGRLTITLPSALTRARLTSRIAEFSRLHPGIELRILYSDRTHDLISEGIDLAIRAGDLPDSTLKSCRIGQVERRLVCSPTYLANLPLPSHPQDLTSWEWIRLAMLPQRRTLTGPNDERVTVEYASRLSVDNVEAMTQFCLQGLGLATPPMHLVEKALNSNELVEVLPAWQVEAIPIYALWPDNKAPHSNTRRLLDFLRE
ncbi:LysR family transcriptional regulator [uncultured Desulfuromusa sp.]|uniref:LysR family transcriptional regulator n=1 Tax=uncultured Desulfuromusa sp. TaxID=219183 RepID=UPI002AA9340B|nr:LysR family transcriptional regulator [uncultured Desulfuromusa sp.]